jgi:hypothetical protein
MPILGIIASQDYVRTPPSSYESIATVTVGSGGSASVSFTSIPSTYTHLQIRGIGRDANSAYRDSINIRFNSDTGSNYSAHYLVGNGASASAFAWTSDSSIKGPFAVGDLGLSNNFSASVFDILDYANTNKYKTTRTLNGFDNNNNGSVDFDKGIVGISSGLWQSTSAINAITLFCAGNWNQYTQFALYGIK